MDDGQTTALRLRASTVGTADNKNIGWGGFLNQSAYQSQDQERPQPNPRKAAANAATNSLHTTIMSLQVFPLSCREKLPA